MTKLSNIQGGRCGELLVQLKLLMCGIESAQMTTDNGIDLVAFSQRLGRPKTIQIKANIKGKPAGGKGKLHLQWNAKQDSKADIFAFVDLDGQRVWLIETNRLVSVAQQNKNGKLNFFMALDPTTRLRRDGKPVHLENFNEFLFENRVSELF